MREQAFLNNQKDVVETIADRQEEIGQLCDDLNKKEIANKRLKQIHIT